MPVPTAPPPGAAPAGPPNRRRAAGRSPQAAAAGRPPTTGAPVNDLLPFLDFVEHHPVGSSVNGVVESYSSHGAYVTVGDLRGYVPLRLMSDPPPRSAREVMHIGDAVTLVVDSFAPARRSVDLAVPQMAPGAPVVADARSSRSSPRRWPRPVASPPSGRPRRRPRREAPAPADAAAKRAGRKKAAAVAEQPHRPAAAGRRPSEPVARRPPCRHRKWPRLPAS